MICAIVVRFCFFGYTLVGILRLDVFGLKSSYCRILQLENPIPRYLSVLEKSPEFNIGIMFNSDNCDSFSISIQDLYVAHIKYLFVNFSASGCITTGPTPFLILIDLISFWDSCLVNGHPWSVGHQTHHLCAFRCLIPVMVFLLLTEMCTKSSFDLLRTYLLQPCRVASSSWYFVDDDRRFAVSLLTIFSDKLASFYLL